MQMERTKPVTVEALVRFARELKAAGRTSATFAETAKYIGCHHPSVRNFLMGSLSKKHVAELSAALNVAVRVEKAATGHVVKLGDA